jgi:uncharacterized damage-inducible protein DinB
MTDLAALLDETLEAWRYARQGFIDEADNIPAGDWGFRPTPANRDVSELVRHILESGLMAVGELTHPRGDFTRQSFPDHIREHAATLPDEAPRERWLQLLRDTLEDGVGQIREYGADGMARSIRQFNGEPASRLTWFNHHIAHEEYHRGQLALYARLTGEVPALTKRIRGG